MFNNADDDCDDDDDIDGGVDDGDDDDLTIWCWFDAAALDCI